VEDVEMEDSPFEVYINMYCMECNAKKYCNYIETDVIYKCIIVRKIMSEMFKSEHDSEIKTLKGLMYK
jgi:hypothetical protein